MKIYTILTDCGIIWAFSSYEKLLRFLLSGENFYDLDNEAESTDIDYNTSPLLSSEVEALLKKSKIVDGNSIRLYTEENTKEFYYEIKRITVR
jgi:hypothetical protein